MTRGVAVTVPQEFSKLERPAPISPAADFFFLWLKTREYVSFGLGLEDVVGGALFIVGRLVRCCL